MVGVLTNQYYKCLVKKSTIGNACYLASVGPTIKRAVHPAPREGSFLLSSPAMQDCFFFIIGKRKKRKRRMIDIIKNI